MRKGGGVRSRAKWVGARGQDRPGFCVLSLCLRGANISPLPPAAPSLCATARGTARPGAPRVGETALNEIGAWEIPSNPDPGLFVNRPLGRALPIIARNGEFIKENGPAQQRKGSFISLVTLGTTFGSRGGCWVVMPGAHHRCLEPGTPVRQLTSLTPSCPSLQGRLHRPCLRLASPHQQVCRGSSG